MKYVEVIANAGSADTIAEVAARAKATDFRLGVVGEDGMQQMRMLVSDNQVQRLLDILQTVLGAQPMARIVVLAVEVSIPRPDEGERKAEDSATAARESLYEGVEKSTRLDGNYFILVVLSTVVAAIGLIEDNVAVVIGAMVIAPLLGPNLALSLGTALGDIGLMKKAVSTLVVGILMAVALSALLAYVWPSTLMSHEVMARTNAGLESVALALASGAAAALSLTTGLSSVLVGVMVAVALLPPAAVLGLMLGEGRFDLAAGAGLLLAVNIVCVNLASKIVFVAKGISPRKWLEKEKAKRAMVIYVLGWAISLLGLVFVILERDALIPANLDQAIEHQLEQSLGSAKD
ncbi:TIGR00341 family protein [Thiocystis violacea]|uniref:TIGR00341 family protein n=1 Tax=Thiocystis violacea TaxID=13725 RepID=UPI001903792A|nr:TIGR00341 family protein [Thiocystis violacea]MBK1723059.1 TIGR00341 family protein [Thiocystis violacea]